MKRKRAHGIETGEKLVEAAIEKLLQGKSHEVTTGELAKRAGIVQSGFYAHFSSVEACLALAAERIAERVRGVVGSLQQEELLTQQLASPASVEPTQSHFRRVLEFLSSYPHFLELLAAPPKGNTPLGLAMHTVRNDLVEQTTDYLIQLGRPWGVRAKDRATMSAHARLVVSATLEAARALNEKDSRRMWSEVLAKHVFFGVLATYIEQRRAGRALARDDARDSAMKAWKDLERSSRS